MLGVGGDDFTVCIEHHRDISFRRAPDLVDADHQPHVRHARDSLESLHDIPFVARRDAHRLFGQDDDLRAAGRGSMHQIRVQRDDIRGVAHVI